MAGWRRGLLGLVLAVTILLSGCVDYDIGLQFDSQTHGVWSQRIQLGGRFSALSASTQQAWLDAIAQRAEALGAQVHQPQPQQLDIRLPFNSGPDLVARFNQFFSPAAEFPTVAGVAVPQVRLDLTQRNWLVVLQTHLTWQVDWAEARPAQPVDLVSADPVALAEVTFHLDTPWGSRLDEALPDATWQKSRVWQIPPMGTTTVEATFWLPSPIGIGAVAIAGLVGLGYGLKYGFGRPPSPSRLP